MRRSQRIGVSSLLSTILILVGFCAIFGVHSPISAKEGVTKAATAIEYPLGKKWKANQKLRIAFLTDLHVVPGNAADETLPKMIDEINQGGFDLLILSGDFTNSGSDVELTNVSKKLKKFTIPYFVIPGNHETCWSESACTTFNKLWGNDRFAFRVGDFFFVGFSTGPFVKMGDGHVKAEDLHWLKKTLDQNAKNKKTKVIVICHYPLNTGLDNWNAVTDILKQYNTVACFGGHEHRVHLYNYDGIPGFISRSMYMGDEPAGYAVIELTKNGLAYTPLSMGQPIPEKPTYAFAWGDTSLIQNEEIHERPAPQSFPAPDGVKITELVAEDASIFGGVASHSNTIYYGTSLGDFKAFDIVTKKVLWTTSLTDSIFSTPVYADGIVAVGSSTGEVVGMSAETGEIVWRVPAHAAVSNDGFAKDGFLYIGLGREEFCKLDIRTGEKVWSFSDIDPGMFQARPVVADSCVVFGVWNNHLYCLDEATGAKRWVWDSPKPAVLYSPGNVIPVVANGRVIFAAPDRYLNCVSLADGSQIWRDNPYTVRESMGQSVDGETAYAKTMDGQVIAVPTTADSLETRWVCDTGIGYEHVACPILEDAGIVYIGSRQGVVVAIDAATGERLWAFQGGTSAMNRLTELEDGSIIFTLIEGKIFHIQPKR